jgi:flavin reductase (DIM6/NTAB) family NADH-FMN oxidoreductase RutF
MLPGHQLLLARKRLLKDNPRIEPRLTRIHIKVSHNPPLLSVSFQLPTKRPKDTRENIRSTKEFTVNIISEPFVEAANSCSVEAPDYVDEWLISGLTPEPSVSLKVINHI